MLRYGMSARLLNEYADAGGGAGDYEIRLNRTASTTSIIWDCV